METLLPFLQSVFPMSDELIDHLSSILKQKKLAKRDYLLKAGHVSRNAYFVEKGLLRCFYLKGDREVCSWFMKESDVIFSIGSFYQQIESYEYIQALEDVTVFYIEFSELQNIYKTYPEFNFIGRVLTEKYHALWDRQLYGLRMQNSTERFNWLKQNHSELFLRVHSKYLASYLGITEVTLSKLKGKQ